MKTQEVLLEVRNVTKNFGGVLAVDKLSFDVRRGQLKAIIGPNGAGKTTLFNLVTGIYPCCGGEIIFKGKPITSQSPHIISKSGIARTFQIPQLFSNMTVLENVMVGCHGRTKTGMLDAAIPLRKTKEEEEGIRQTAKQWLKFFELDDRSESLAETIPFGERRILEIARGLAAQPDLLLLDEPAAGLNDKEREWLAELLLAIRKMEITIVWVEHVMSMVMSIADEIVVMDWGKKICEGTPEQIQIDKRVIEAYLGVGNG